MRWIIGGAASLALALVAGGGQARAQQYRSVTFLSSNGQYLSADGGGGGAVYANRSSAGAWETFVLRDQNGGELRSGDIVQVQALNGQYWSAEGGGGDVVNANRNQFSGWEAFRVVRRSGDGIVTPDDDVALVSLRGYYLSADRDLGGKLVANRNNWGTWETFRLTVGNAVIRQNSLAWPIGNKRVTGFGFGDDWLENGRDGSPKRHNGYDIGASAGTPVFAAASGKVAWTGVDSSGWGGWVVLEHTDYQGHAFTTLYFHVSPSVRRGDAVTVRQQIGTVYNLTRSKPHLHYSVRNAPFQDGWWNAVDPQSPGSGQYAGAASAANRGALTKTGSYYEKAGWCPRYPEFFVDPGMCTSR